MSKLDLTNKQFGEWLVLNEMPKNTRKQAGVRSWRCQCLRCKKIYEVTQPLLTNGRSKKCIKCRQNELKTMLDITGQVYGSWLVLKKCDDYVKTDGAIRSDYWVCLCQLCNKEHLIRYGNLKHNRTKKCSECANNGTKHSTKTLIIQKPKNFKILKGKTSKRWTGYEDIPGAFFARLKSCAGARNIAVEITIKDIWDKFIEQNRICALSGIDITFKAGKNNINPTASVDRINSCVGYTKDNIQLVHKCLNTMKWDLSQEEFIEWCGKVWSFNNG